MGAQVSAPADLIYCGLLGFLPAWVRRPQCLAPLLRGSSSASTLRAWMTQGESTMRAFACPSRHRYAALHRLLSVLFARVAWLLLQPLGLAPAFGSGSTFQPSGLAPAFGSGSFPAFGSGPSLRVWLSPAFGSGPQPSGLAPLRWLALGFLSINIGVWGA